MFHSSNDLKFRAVLFAITWITSLLVALIIGFVAWEAWPAIALGPLKFISDPAWDPSLQDYYLVPMVLGSASITIGAIILALPIGIASALLFEYLAPSWIAKPLRAIIEILSGIPSVIYGFWGLIAIVPLLYKLSPPGANVLAGIIVLGIMILPTLSIFVANGIQSITKEQIQSCKSLGLSKTTTITQVIMPSIRQHILNGTIISLGRAVGETMAVLMVCGNIVKIPQSIFDPVRTLTSNIALEMAYALDAHRSALFLSGFILLLIIVSLALLGHSKALGKNYE